MRWLSKAYNILIFAFLYIPILMIILFSFNTDPNQGRWLGFTLNWYVELFQNDQIMEALLTTVIVALAATVISTIIGTMAAVGFYGMSRKLRQLMMTVNNIPMVNPEIVTGVSMMLLFTFVYRLLPWFEFGYATLIIAHVTFCIPYVVLQVLPKLRQMNKHMYEAALDLGCRPVTAFFKVILPEILPGVITGALMAFTISLDDFVVSLFTSGTSHETLSVAIFAMLKKMVTPDVNALSALMFATILILLLLINVFQARDQKRREKTYL